MVQAAWFVILDGVPQGPWDAGTLRRLAAEGRIGPDTQVGTTMSGPWRSARQAGLFNSSGPPPLQPGPPLPGGIRPPGGLPPPVVPRPAAPRVLPPRSRVASGPPAAKRPADSRSPPPVAGETHPPVAAGLAGGPPGWAHALIWVACGALVVQGLATVGFNQESLQAGSSPALIALMVFLVAGIVSIGSETALLTVAWMALPVARRPFQLHPAIVVGLVFLPIFGLAWYFVAYGMLGQAWGICWKEAAPESEEARNFSATWTGFFVAALLVVAWIMWWPNIFGADMSWWTQPLLSGDARVRPRGGRAGGFVLMLKIFSFKAIFDFFLAFMTIGFYGSMLEAWKAVDQRRGA